ncbi:hypothetical protein IG631_15292 [Alternaria alternata]|nr:hypothetical protein IG631_15292 [Alternaria alternata]
MFDGVGPKIEARSCTPAAQHSAVAGSNFVGVLERFETAVHWLHAPRQCSPVRFGATNHKHRVPSTAMNSSLGASNAKATAGSYHDSSRVFGAVFCARGGSLGANPPPRQVPANDCPRRLPTTVILPASAV